MSTNQNTELLTWLTDFFGLMLAHYGQLWEDRYGLQDSGIWAFTLKELPVWRLNEGVARFFNGDQSQEFVTFPPSPLAFKHFCLGGQHKEDRLPKLPLWLGTSGSQPRIAHSQTKEEWEERKAIAKKHIAKCWEVLGVKREVNNEGRHD